MEGATVRHALCLALLGSEALACLLEWYGRNPSLTETATTLPVLEMLRVQCPRAFESRLLNRSLIYSNIRSSVRYIQRDAAASRATRESPVAFVFDIDGVLIQGSNVLPEAKRALRILEGENELGIKIPYILLTNGGGISEEERCKKLSKMLDHPIELSQYIQAHTILKSLAHKYDDQPVLVLGGRQDILDVARGYGFKHPYSTLDIKAWNSSVWPFRSLTEEEKASAQKADFSDISFRAILVFHDPRDWALDTQIALDVIRSGGVVGGPHLPASVDPNVDLVFCNPDLLWRNEFPRPRLGQGAFKEAFQAVYKASTGTTYPYLQFGKPTTATYKFAEKVLRDRIAEVQGGQSARLPQIFMVGDNPASDIAGANGAGWNSVLVHTGVYDPADGHPAHEPTFQAANVEEAVRKAIAHAVKGGSRS